MKHLFSIIIVFCFTPMLLAQPVQPSSPMSPNSPQTTPPGEYVPSSLPPRPAMALQGVSPDLLQRIQSDLNLELKQIQRALDFIDPQDSHLSQTLSTRQTEVLAQLKDITQQLKNAGVVTPDVIANETKPANDSPFDASLSRPTPTLQTPAGVYNNNSPLQPVTRPSQFTSVPPLIPTDPMMPQDVTAISNDSWDTPPSKELVLLRQTISEMRNEITTLRQDIKALETQVRLLNQNILLQTKPATGQ
ncbi:MAG: hypothetical protein LBU65_00435 [Planctomycetaceae bacterium]|jgi:hypothetical protein|nr:hypothetical protein [Planctomycetaceae bacterium]